MTDAGNSRYEPEGEIARGGMGVVLRVKDIDLDRPLAMKRMASAPDATGGGIESDRFARFMEEAQVTAQLDHPAIVPVHDLGFDDDGTGWYTMKLVEGRELGQIFDLARGGADDWNIARAVRVLVQVCQALAYAHGKGVIHRDLKPANIMVGEFGEVYVMDWGLAKVEGSEVSTPRAISGGEGVAGGSMVTLDGSVMGTPEFMPPEQARGEMDAVDEQSDVYSVGAMLYQLLAGRPPFLGESREVVKAVATGPPDALPKDVPTELAAICNKAMAREKSQRYTDAGELERDLTRYLDGRVVQAHQSGAWAEFKKLVQRNKAVTAAVATAFGVLVALLVSQSISNKKLETSRTEAVSALEMMALSQGFSAGKSLDQGAASFWFNDAASRANDPEDAETHRARARIANSRHVPCVRALRVAQKWPGPRRMEFSSDSRYLTLAHGSGTGGARRDVLQIVDVDAESLVTAPDGSTLFSDVAYCPLTGRIAAAPMEWQGMVHVWRPAGESSTIQSDEKVSSVEFSPDGARLFIGANWGRLFDFPTGAFLPAVFSYAKKQSVRDVKFSDDGELLAVTVRSRAPKETKLRVFKLGEPGADALFPALTVRNDHPWIRFIDGGESLTYHADPPRSVIIEARTGAPGKLTGLIYQDWHPKRSFAVTDRAVFDPTTGERKMGLNGLGIVRFRPQNDTLLVTSPSLRELSLIDGSTVRTIGSDRRSTEHLAVSADGNLLASWEVGGLVRFWNLQGNDWGFPARLLGNLIFSSSGNYITRAGRVSDGRQPPSTGPIQVYDVNRREPAGPPLEFEGNLADSDFSPDEKTLATAHRTGSIKIWDWNKGEVSSSVTGLPSAPTAICHAPDGSWLAAYCKNGELVRVDPTSGEAIVLTADTVPLQQISTTATVQGLGFSESGRWLVLWALCQGVLVWDCERNELAKAPPLGGSTTAVGQLEIRGERLVFIEQRGRLKTLLHDWDLTKGEYAREAVEINPGNCSGFTLSNDGRRVLISYRSAESVRLGELMDDGNWKWQTVYELGNGKAFFVPDTPYAISLSESFPCQVRLVDLRDLRALVSPLTDPLGVGFRPVMSPDGRRLAVVFSSGAEGHARVWELLSMLDPAVDPLDAEGRRAFTELAAEGALGAGGWRSLDPAGWLARWQEFRLKYPAQHPLPK